MAGAVGDCLTLIERLEQALDQTAGTCSFLPSGSIPCLPSPSNPSSHSHPFFILIPLPGNLTRACVALAKAWRTEKYLRHLDAYFSLPPSLPLTPCLPSYSLGSQHPLLPLPLILTLVRSLISYVRVILTADATTSLMVSGNGDVIAPEVLPVDSSLIIRLI